MLKGRISPESNKRRQSPFAVRRHEKAAIPALRKPRADAQHNRDPLLGIAHEAFAKEGALVSLDNIAKKAGVGAVTL